MKKLALAMFACLSGICILAQGTVNFCNLNGGSGLNAPVFQEDGTTKLVGPNYVAQLLYSATAGGTYSFVGTPAPFLTGGGAGYFNGGVIALPGIAGGATAWLEVVVWDTTLGGTTSGATEAQAYSYWSGQAGQAHNVWGVSGYTPFAVVTGNPTATPPGLPAPLVGLQSFNLAIWIPEPSSFALLALGVAVLGAARRVVK